MIEQLLQDPNIEIESVEEEVQVTTTPPARRARPRKNKPAPRRLPPKKSRAVLARETSTSTTTPPTTWIVSPETIGPMVARMPLLTQQRLAGAFLRSPLVATIRPLTVNNVPVIQVLQAASSAVQSNEGTTVGEASTSVDPIEVSEVPVVEPPAPIQPNAAPELIGTTEPMDSMTEEPEVITVADTPDPTTAVETITDPTTAEETITDPTTAVGTPDLTTAVDTITDPTTAVGNPDPTTAVDTTQVPNEMSQEAATQTNGPLMDDQTRVALVSRIGHLEMALDQNQRIIQLRNQQVAERDVALNTHANRLVGLRASLLAKEVHCQSVDQKLVEIEAQVTQKAHRVTELEMYIAAKWEAVYKLLE